MWPRVPRADFERGKGDLNRRAFRRIVSTGHPPGVLAYAGGEPAGWCAIGPRTEMKRLEKSRVLEPVDDQPVWSVVCFFVARPFRRRGLSVALLEAAVRFAHAQGARIVEGYPVDPKGAARAADAFLWTGIASTFRRAGFDEALRRSPTRPIMRRTLRGGAARATQGGAARRPKGEAARAPKGEAARARKGEAARMPKGGAARTPKGPRG
jgi:GNAT superfamily N-acetyltransferase